MNGWLDVPRYRWERSGARTLLPQRRTSPDPSVLTRIQTWAARWPLDPLLSICIPTRDRLDLLMPCLDSLLRTCSMQPVEVVLGDTGSTPETLAAYSSMGIEPVSIPGPFNFSGACNRMAEAARGRRLLFLNSDTTAITADWVRRLAQTPEDAIVGACLAYPRTRRIQSVGIRPVRQRRWPQPSTYGPPPRSRSRFALQSTGLGRRHDQTPATADPVMAVSGAFLAASRRRFDRLGGFDTAYRVDLQDVDLCLRAHAHGMEVVCRRDIVFAHRHAGSRGRYAFPADDWRLFTTRWSKELEQWSDG